MIIGRWLLIETLGRADTWSVLAVGTQPRAWKSFPRAVPGRLQPLVAEVHASKAALDQTLPLSRLGWSGRRLHAVPVVGPGENVHAVKLWVGDGDPPPEVGVAPFVSDAKTRRIESNTDGLGPDFETPRTHWAGAESFEMVERFDGALDLMALIAHSQPGTRWLGTATVRSTRGPRSLLMGTRNGDHVPDRQRWLGVAVDVTESVPPQRKSFEATTLDLLHGTQPNLYLAIVDTTQVRLIRWVTEPLPEVRWGCGTDERTVPHPADRTRIMAARKAILAGAPHESLTGVRLATEHGGWIISDLEISPLPGGTLGSTAPEFALVQLNVGDRD
ncbi:GAF domain-containing protein [Nocardia australiensis]|uniref:GAF domain-containing protein n=1 Tax=Nocardia australiensis TaxID=2887191 RepID=UPI001D15D9C5|nr:GAF domain-containing protein [Nocardia australiensis]